MVLEVLIASTNAMYVLETSLHTNFLDRPHCRKLEGHHELPILGLLMETPAIYSVKISGTTVSVAIVCRLQKHGYTHKRKKKLGR